MALGLALAAAVVPLAASAADIPLPPPPPGMKRIPLPPPPPGTSLRQRPGAAQGPERCGGCHAKLTQARVVHGALQKHDCTSCHKAITAERGKCRSISASKWALVRTEPELCYGCHARMDQAKYVHTAVRQGSCLSCHDAHSSNYAGRIKQPRERICFHCHEQSALATKPVKHAPVSEGRCLDCHDAHRGEHPHRVKAATETAHCLKCHEAKAPAGPGTPGPRFRIDMSKKFVHAAFKKIECGGCHDGGGHGSENLKLLKKNAGDLCNSCHERKDKTKYPHSAVVLGDCAVCHDPHTSDNQKRIRGATYQEMCFLCHQDDLTGRKVIHKPIAKGCDQCHQSHGGPYRFGLKGGEGDASCYVNDCHKPVDAGKNKHAALERYGCGACHDSHATGYPGLMVKRVNDTCAACHPQHKDGRHVTPILSRGHVVGGDLKDPKRKGRTFSCASCHNPHGSNFPDLAYVGSTPTESCAWCHGDKSGKHPELKNVITEAQRQPGTSTGSAGTGGGSAVPGFGAGSGGAVPGSGGAVPGSGGAVPGSGGAVPGSGGGLGGPMSGSGAGVGSPGGGSP